MKRRMPAAEERRGEAEGEEEEDPNRLYIMSAKEIGIHVYVCLPCHSFIIFAE
jgi:hypothetical protein